MPTMMLTFVTLAGSEREARAAALLAVGLRDFGGRFTDSAFHLLVPSGRDVEAARPLLERHRVEVTPFALDPAPAAIPFGAKAAAAAHAEATIESERLVWLDADTLIVGEPAPFLLPAEVVLGFRPVHHRLIGVPWGERPGEFWEAVDEFCGAGRTFPVVTSTGERIRAYFNAGSYVVDPSRRLLRTWREALDAAAAALSPHLEEDPLRRVFLHQAIFTGVALALTDPMETMDLGTGVNYPIHLHGEVPPHLRPPSIESLVTVRYEDVLDDPEWRERAPWGNRLTAWLEHHAPA
jgi:hypothetical protein